MASVLFVVLFVAILLDLQGIIQNPYFNFLIYLVLGPLFVFGVLLVLIGILYSRGREDIGFLTFEYLKEQISLPGHFSRIRKLIYLTSLITFVTIFVVSIVSYTAFHYTESDSFCGQFCHKVMNPELVTYRNSAHSRIPCVKCHIGAGAAWVTKAKFSGVRQMFAVALDSYSRPISTPITALRPVRKTCEECHRPEKFHGDKLYVKDKFLPDQNNTHVQTVMLMKIGSGGYSGRKANGIHWHVSENIKVLYKSDAANPRDISQVMMVGPDNKKVIYSKAVERDKSGSASFADAPRKEKVRLMDCMDCHNRPTHIFLSPDEALDQKLLTDTIPRKMPYIKRQALAAINRKYASDELARQGIAKELRGWYQRNYPDLVKQDKGMLDKAVKGVQDAYAENVFPGMKIGWGTYENFIGHKDGGGCFRCHGGLHKTDAGKVIPNGCDVCHVILAEDKPAPDVIRLLTSSGN